MTRFPILIFVIAMLSFIGLEIYVHVHDRGRREASRDAGSLKTIARMRGAAFLVGFFFAFFPIISIPWGRDIHFIIGAALIMCAFFVRGSAVLKLNEYFTSLVMTQENQKLITDGPYRYIRHPAYSGALLFYMGIAVALGSIVGFILILALNFYGFHQRIKVEEEVMISAFGDEYSDYIKTTKRLIPLIY